MHPARGPVLTVNVTWARHSERARHKPPGRHPTPATHVRTNRSVDLDGKIELSTAMSGGTESTHPLRPLDEQR